MTHEEFLNLKRTEKMKVLRDLHSGESVNWLNAEGPDLDECHRTGTVPTIWTNSGKPSNPKAGSYTATSANVSHNGDDLADIIARTLQGRIKAGLDETQVEELVDRLLGDRLERYRPPIAQIEITRIDGTKQNIGRQHKDFLEVLALVRATKKVFLVGPAGSGKTTLAHNIAKALNLPFEFNGAIDTSYKLSGFIDAEGRFVSTAFYRAYKDGGVYLFDEVDSSLPSAVLAFNAALANGSADFPCGRVEQHPDFYCMAAGNTYGHGATAQYVGRTRQDGAFLDRFALQTLPYDEDLENEVATEIAVSIGGEACRAPVLKFVAYVQNVRRVVDRKGLQVIVSPRASFFGASIIGHNAVETNDKLKISNERIAATCVKKGISEDHWKSIVADAGEFN